MTEAAFLIMSLTEITLQREFARLDRMAVTSASVAQSPAACAGPAFWGGLLGGG